MLALVLGLVFAARALAGALDPRQAKYAVTLCPDYANFPWTEPPPSCSRYDGAWLKCIDLEPGISRKVSSYLVKYGCCGFYSTAGCVSMPAWPNHRRTDRRMRRLVNPCLTPTTPARTS